MNGRVIVSAKNIGMQINLTRGSTNTNTPKLKDIIVEGMVVPGNGNLTYQHEMIIDIDQTAMALDVGTETIYDNLKTVHVDRRFLGTIRSSSLIQTSINCNTTIPALADDWTWLD